MSVAYFLELSGKPSSSENVLSESLLATLAQYLLKLPALNQADLLTPESSQDPFLDDGDGPLLVLQVRFRDQQALSNALNSPVMETLLEYLHNLPVVDAQLVQEALKIESYPLKSGGAETTATAGAIAYLVNYQRPAEDEAAFLQYYRAHHPPIMLQFPALCRLELGLPIGWCPLMKNISWANRMLFCEVSFNSLAALNNALASEVRTRLREDFHDFPPFSGKVTHYAMRRQSLPGLVSAPLN